MNNNIYRIINTVVAAIGTLVCIVSGFIPAPNGLLSDGTISLIQALPGSQKVWMFLVPSLLFIAATVMAGAGRLRIVSLITVLAGACIFAWMDLSYIQSSMAFTGTLANELGIVIALSGILLHVFGTPKSDSPKAEERPKKAAQGAEKEEDPDPLAAVTGNQTGFYDGSEDTVVTPTLMGRDTMEFRDTLVDALRKLTEEQQEESTPAGAAPAEEMTTAEAIAAEAAPADATMGYTQVLWSSDEELEALLRADSEVIEEAAAIEIPEKVTTEEIAAAAKSVDDYTIVFDAGLEDLFIDEE